MVNQESGENNDTYIYQVVGYQYGSEQKPGIFEQVNDPFVDRGF